MESLGSFLIDLTNAKIYVIHDGYVTIAPLKNRDAEMTICHIKLTNEGIKLKNKPKTDTEKEFSKAYHYLYNRQQYIKSSGQRLMQKSLIC